MIETRRLLIRDVEPSDAAAFCGYMAGKEYWEHLPIETPGAAQVQELLERCRRDQAADPRDNYFMAAVLKETGELVGEAILRIASRRHRQGEIGWGVDRRYSGRGIATEIGRALLGFGFETLGLHRIFGQCRQENLASQRIMEKLGMREEGVIREHIRARGEWWSSSQWSILDREFLRVPD
ncbi:MAG TPA: GNAT family protein [Stellaceae bacterium]|nr:GNAT family protein [Stellaceae bacterium]